MGRRLRRGTDGGSRPSPNGSAPTTVVGSGATSSPGVAVAALIVPKNLGYAGIAGIPLQNGLYAAAAGAILYAVFGTSRQISTGPSSGLAAVAASAVAVAWITGIQNAASFVAGSRPCSRWGGSRSSCHWVNVLAR